MRIVAERLAQLPRRAWVAQLRRGESLVRLTCGADVEVGASAWVEGAWPGKRTETRLEATWLAGSGGGERGDEVVFVPAGHSLESLYATRDDDRVIVANSLAFLLAAADLELLDDHPHYTRRFLDVIGGLRRHDIVLPSRQGVDVHVLTLAPLWVSRDLSWRFSVPASPGRFLDFAHYRSSLTEALGRLAANAAEGRTSRVTTTISSGYDSPACAVLAREVGCHRAVTIRRARDRSDRSVHDDSGAALAGMLGLEVREERRDTRLSVAGVPLVDEFWSTGQSGEDIVMRVFEDELDDALLVTGFYGDIVWSPTAPVTTWMRRGDVAGASMGEFRLRVGFTHVPLPFHGSLEHPSIHAITVGDEMRPWSIPDGYDRPIARRIVEEAGVPREAFGRAKRAVTTTGQRRRITDPVVRAELAEFARRRGHDWRTRLPHRVVDAGFVATRTPMRVLRPAARSVGWHVDNVRRQGLHGLEGAIAFLWAVDRIRTTRYEPALGG